MYDIKHRIYSGDAHDAHRRGSSFARTKRGYNTCETRLERSRLSNFQKAIRHFSNSGVSIEVFVGYSEEFN